MAVRKITHGRGTSYEATLKVHGKVVRRRFPTRKAAADFYARTRADAAVGAFTPVDRGRVTFAEFTGQWLAGLQVRPATSAVYSSHLRNHLLPVFGPMRLDRVTRRDVTEFVRLLSAGHLAPSTVRAVYNLLRTILRAAVHDGRVTASPCHKIALPEIPPRELAVLTPGQVRSLLDGSPQHHAVLATAVGTGLRQAELLGLTARAVDLGSAVLHVRQQLITPAGPGQPYLTTLLKTRSSARTVPLPGFVIDAIREPVKRAAHHDTLLFPNPRGVGWRRGSFNDSVWKPALRRAGLPSGYGLHALRHTYASSLIAAGHHPRVIQARLGHSSITEAMDTYGHLFPDAHLETIAALDAIFGAR